MRNRFDLQLEKLNSGLIEMGSLVEQAVERAIDALMTHDTEKAEQNMEFDKEIDQKMKELENLCLKLLLSQQPVARDLRLISSALKMVSDLERIGDQCADISEIVTVIPSGADWSSLKEIPDMAMAVKKMVSESVDAFVRGDTQLAQKVCDDDDTVDYLFTVIRQRLVEEVRSGHDLGEMIVDLLMVIKYFERIGDHAVNVAKWVIFSITGNRNGSRYLSSEFPD